MSVKALNNHDGLITDVNPAIEVRGRVIAHGTAEQTYPRGTVFARSAQNSKLYLLGSMAASGDTLVPDCILCAETVVGKTDDVTAEVYTAGCFDLGKVTVKESYEIKEMDKDELRKRNIVFKSAFKAE